MGRTYIMKQPNFKKKVIAAAIALSTVTGAVNAAELEVITVSSQKRVENVQDLAIAVTALSGDDIKTAGAVDFETLSDSIPNVNIVSSSGNKIVSIRGLGSGSGNPSFEQSVGLYIDGVYASRIELFAEPFMDIERLEVLKGPQGVILGKNSIAGAMVINSAKPTQDFEASISGDYEFEYESYQLTGVVSGGLTDDLAGRFAFKKSSRGTYLDNANTEGNGVDGGGDDNSTIRGSLLWDVSENTEIYFKVEHSDVEILGSTFQATADYSEGSVPSILDLVGPGVIPNGDIIDGLYFPSIAAGEDFIFDDTTYASELEGAEQISDNITFKITHQLGDHELVYIAGYSGFEKDTYTDNDWTASRWISVIGNKEFEQTSHELRIVSPKGETIDYIAGIYYLDREFDRTNKTNVFADVVLTHGLGGTAVAPGPFAGTNFLAASSLQTYNEVSTSIAVFAQATWNIADNFRVSVGGRYSEDEKTGKNGETGSYDYDSFDLLSERANVYDQTRNAVLATVFGPGIWNYEKTLKEESFDPSFSAQWNINDDTMTYVSVTKATKAGGFDAAEGVNDPDVFQYDPEEATGFEIGLKMDLLDGSARLNVAIFRTDFDDLQVSSYDPNANNSTGAYVTTNAGSATSQGIEIDGLYAVSDNLTVGASVAYLQAEYTEFTSSCPLNPLEQANLNCTPVAGSTTGAMEQDLAGYQMERSPEYSGTMFAEYFTTIDEMNAGVRFDVIYQGDVMVSPSQDSNLAADAYAKLNLNFTLNSADDTWVASLGVFNITDEQPTTSGGEQAFVPGTYFLSKDRGREIKVSATYYWF